MQMNRRGLLLYLLRIASVKLTYAYNEVNGDVVSTKKYLNITARQQACLQEALLYIVIRHYKP